MLELPVNNKTSPAIRDNKATPKSGYLRKKTKEFFNKVAFSRI
jgi:hypothetical protein